jgi:UDP-N-acetylmuramoyl-L-alanyl-D-glutamate--2,6-diaminopimelate ligase
VEIGRIGEALAATGVLNPAAVAITDLAYDTRAVSPGALFFCVRGGRLDRHELAGEAVARGAVGLVVEHEVDAHVPQLLVPDVRHAMGPAAVAFFGDPSRDLDVLGVTGTAGKTTTTYLLDSILRAAGRTTGLMTNIERRVGGEPRPAGLNTPEAIDLQRLLREMLVAGDQACVLEATSHASVQGRLDGVRFAVLVFTNLAHDHLDFHGSMEEYFQAKRRLFAQADRAVVYVGD